MPEPFSCPLDEPCKGYQIIRAHLDIEREVQKKLILERDKWFNEAMRLRNELSAARDALRNDFEPDNQSLAFKRADAAISAIIGR